MPPLRPDQIERLKAKYPGLIVDEGCAVVDSWFGSDVVLCAGVDVYFSRIHDHTSISPRTYICWAEIGKYCSVGPNSFVGLAGHPSRGFVSTHPLFYTRLPERNLDWADKSYFDGGATTCVGNDVWIGGNVSIRSGVRIGDGAIIGAGAVITRDVQPYAVVAGVPGRVLRHRFTPAQIAFLLEFKWWDRDEAFLREHFRDFHDIDAFMKTYARP